MATRWLYITNHPTGTNYCQGMTVDDTNTVIPESDELPDSWKFAWTANDPTLVGAATQDLVPLKRYNIAQNEIHECNAAQNAAWNLQLARIKKNGQVDRKTQRLFAKGLDHDGASLPLDVDDSLNYTILYENRNNASVVTWPKDVIQRNRTLYTISNSNAMKTLGEAAFARIFAIVDGARDLKDQIRQAADVAAVDAIVDSRT